MNEGKTSNYKEKLRQHYVPLVAKYGDSFQSVDWGSPQSQKKRFEVLLESLDFEKSSILDFGCGVGHMVDYLKAHNFCGRYLGVDLVTEMVQCASKRHPDVSFRVIDSIKEIDNFLPEAIVASGLFTFAGEAELEETIGELFKVTRKVVAFNSLSAWGSSHESSEYYADPLRILSFCRNLTSRIIFRHDYLPHDFTIYLYKQDLS